MDNWFLSALLALVIYGFWGFFPKIAVQYINPQSAIIYQAAGAVFVGLVAVFMMQFKPDVHPKGILFAFLTGVAGTLGTLFYFAAASRGKISVVASMTALYPVITIVLAAILLKEPITIRQIVGMLFALAAIVLFTG